VGYLAKGIGCYVFVPGMCEGKGVESVIHLLLKLIKHIWIARVSSDRKKVLWNRIEAREILEKILEK
jgi:hypothetical protein